MARNKVQFQKGVSLNDFIKQYGSEAQCFDALYAWRWPKGFQCPACGHDKCCQLTNRKLQQCNRCNRQTSLTAGTIFESTKLPLTLWFQAMVPGYLSDHTGQERHLGHETASSPGYFLQCRLADEAQAYAGDDGAGTQ